MNAASSVPRDPALPNLASLFDKQFMAQSFARHFSRRAGGGLAPLDVLACEIERVKYRPRRNCVVGYRLRLAGSSRSTPEIRRVAVGMYAPEDARKRFAAAIARWPRGVEAQPPAVSLLADLDLLVWSFPHDRKLPSLPLLADAAYLRERCLPALIESRWGGDWRLAGARTRVISYFPEHSCTVSVKAQLLNAATSQTRVWTVYGQTRYDEAGGRAFEVMQRLLESEAHRSGAACFARALHYAPEQRLLWQEGITAQTLDRSLAQPRGGRPAWIGVGRAVAALHTTKLELAPRLTLQAIFEELARAVRVVTMAEASLQRETEDIVADLTARASGIADSPLTTVHGDLHSKNLLVGGGRVFIIDLDRVSAGLPLAELGSLLAEFVYRDCVVGRAIDWRRIAGIIEEYRVHAPRTAESSDIAWHLAAALVRERAYRCVTSLKPGRLEALPRLLLAARQALEHNLAVATPHSPPVMPPVQRVA